MSSKTFSSISNQERAKVYPQIIEHAKTKWNSGEKLAESGDYGGAIGQLIIGMEELVKGLIIQLDSKGFEFGNIKGADILFKRHTIRYFIAFILQTMNLFGTEIAKLIRLAGKNPEAFLKLSEKLKQNPNYFLEEKKFYVLRVFVKLREGFYWFSKMERLRQDGVYSDYQGIFRSPLDMTEEDYLATYNQLSLAFQMGVNYSEAVTLDEMKAALDYTKKNFKDSGFYKRLEVSLETIKKTRNDPFVSILKSINS